MLSRIEELMLVSRCALSDDRDAFGRLVEEYQSDIRRFFINLTGDIALSDDLSQDTFIKAYTGIRGFKGFSRFRTWLYRIAYNEFYDHTRRNKEQTAEQLPEQPETYAGGSDAKIDLAEALKHLNEQERTVVVLYYMEDKPIKDVAAITGMPEGTVKSHISRAKAKLVKFLK